MHDMMEGKFTAVFEKDEGWWIGYIEELPGANTQGKTLDELMSNIQEAVEVHFDEAIEHGEEVNVLSISEFRVGSLGKIACD